MYVYRGKTTSQALIPVQCVKEPLASERLTIAECREVCGFTFGIECMAEPIDHKAIDNILIIFWD